MPVKIRSFGDVVVERGPTQQGLTVRGLVRGDGYVLSVAGAEFQVPVVSTGVDQDGPFAIVTDCRNIVGGGTTLEVFSEDELYAGLTLFRTAPWATAAQAALAPNGNVLMPHEVVVQIHFRHDGSLDYATAPSRLSTEAPTRH